MALSSKTNGPPTSPNDLEKRPTRPVKGLHWHPSRRQSPLVKQRSSTREQCRIVIALRFSTELLCVPLVVPGRFSGGREQWLSPKENHSLL